MTFMEGLTLVIAIVAVAGALYSIWRNGHSHRDSMTEFKTAITGEIKGVKEDLTNPDFGLSALNQKMGNFKVNCATVSTSLKERVYALEDEANKRRPRKRKNQ
ncbi:hypothetical protein ES703_123722 [subsurface metagenome]